ncbi:MAG: FecCD family ABC transporter permease [Candidatus Hodarchaeota archaeon]
MIRFHESNQYRSYLNAKRKRIIGLFTLLIILALSIILGTMFGPLGPFGPGEPDRISFNTVFKTLIFGGLSRSPKTTHEIIIWDVRLPRVMLAALIGLSLAVAGAAMQGIFRNPMADPFILGLSAGAAVGATTAIYLTPIIGFNDYSLSIFAFVFGIGTIFVVYFLARTNGHVDTQTLLLSGIAVGSFMTAISSALIYFSGKHLSVIVFWLMGSLSGANWSNVTLIFVPIFLGSFSIFIFSRHLKTLLLGHETAHDLGINPERTQKIILLLCSFITGIAVAFSGIIGFVGLIIPHAVRLIIGSDYRYLLPASAISGAIFMIWADVVSRTVLSPTELPIGIITSLLGVPFFIYLLRNREKIRM